MNKNNFFQNIICFLQYDKLLNEYKKIIHDYEILQQSINPTKLKPTTTPLRKYQLDTLDFAKTWFKKFEELNIEYFLIGGNLLGAYRNNQFIPWDDDIDIGMMREDFNILLKYLKENCIEMAVDKISLNKENKNYFIQQFLKLHPNKICYAKFYNYLCIFIGTNVSNQISLEIFPYDYYKDDFSLNDLKNYAVYIKKEFVKLDNFQMINDFLAKELNQNQNIVKKSNKIFCGIDHYNFQYFPIPYFFEINDIYPLQLIKYENTMCYVPNKMEKLLFEIYGKSYNQLPKMIYPSEHITYREHIVKSNSKLNLFKLNNTSVLRKIVYNNLKRKFAFFNKRITLRKKYNLYKTAYDFLQDVC